MSMHCTSNSFKKLFFKDKTLFYKVFLLKRHSPINRSRFVSLFGNKILLIMQKLDWSANQSESRIHAIKWRHHLFLLLLLGGEGEETFEGLSCLFLSNCCWSKCCCFWIKGLIHLSLNSWAVLRIVGGSVAKMCWTFFGGHAYKLTILPNPPEALKWSNLIGSYFYKRIEHKIQHFDLLSEDFEECSSE